MVISLKLKEGFHGTVNLFMLKCAFAFAPILRMKSQEKPEMKTRYAIPWLPVNDKPSD